MNILVSIIIPIFNNESSLSRCIDSVLKQSMRDFEVILVNDGSTDNSQSICDFYKYKDSRVVTYYQNNQGVSVARNYAISIAKGRWICFLDADDYIDSDYIHELVKCGETSSADIIQSTIILENEEKVVKTLFPNEHTFDKKKEIDNLSISLFDAGKKLRTSEISELYGFSTGKMYRYSVVSNVMFERKISIREDTIFNLNVFPLCSRICSERKANYHYCVNPEGATQKYRPHYTREITEFIDECSKIWIHNNWPDSSLARGILFCYSQWIKGFAMNERNPLSLSDRLKLIKDSFREDLWIYGFRKVKMKDLKFSYVFLRFLFNCHMASGILLLYYLSDQVKND